MKTVFEIAEGGKKSSLVAPGSSPESVLAVEANRIHLQRSEPFLDALEAARFLKLHPKTLLRLARSGSIPAHPLTGRRRYIWRFLLSELDAWARSRLDSGSDRCQNSRS
jgi:excisionase family DNA binding protein